jgi:hypothetical protein
MSRSPRSVLSAQGRAPWVRACLALAAVLTMLTSSGAASAEPARPRDAPQVAASVEVPPLPPEYLVYDGGWLQLAYHPSARERVRPLIEQADDVRASIRDDLGKDVLEHVNVRVAAVSGELARLAPAEPPAGTSAIAFGEHSLVVLALSSPLSAEPRDLDATLRHLLAHVALDEAAEGTAVPAWLHEAYAVESSGEAETLRAQTMALASLRQELLPLRNLGVDYPESLPHASIARAQAGDFVRFVRDQDERRLGPLVDGFRAKGTLEGAIAHAYGVDVATFEGAWRRDVARRYSFLPIMLGGALVWLLVATFSTLRRARRARASEEREEEPAHEVETTVVHVAPRVVDDSDEPIEPRLLPMAAEVPKIEHDGRWHTLH